MFFRRRRHQNSLKQLNQSAAMPEVLLHFVFQLQIKVLASHFQFKRFKTFSKPFDFQVLYLNFLNFEHCLKFFKSDFLPLQFLEKGKLQKLENMGFGNFIRLFWIRGFQLYLSR
jgi:hypothetical protein